MSSSSSCSERSSGGRSTRREIESKRRNIIRRDGIVRSSVESLRSIDGIDHYFFYRSLRITTFYTTSATTIATTTITTFCVMWTPFAPAGIAAAPAPFATAPQGIGPKRQKTNAARGGDANEPIEREREK